jgi:L-alanine-DL-glutamate epimerase-like enolase superfamily enzyme
MLLPKARLSPSQAGKHHCRHVQIVFEADALSIAQPDATHVGGISECLQVCLLAHQHRLPVALHSWGGGGAGGQLSHRFCDPQLPDSGTTALDNPLIPALLREPFNVRDGNLLPSSAPGLGVQLTDEVLSQYAYRPGSAYQI